MRYDIMTYGKTVLRRKAVPVEKVNDSIRRLAEDMLETMYFQKGLGLAAEQIGREESICVIDIPPDEAADEENPEISMPLVLINPVIVEMNGEQTGQEGCLSFPEIFVSITRAQEVKVSYLVLDNKKKTIKVNGLLARTVQHEVDHLLGILLVDRMSPAQKAAVAGKLKKLKKQSED